MQPWHLSVSSKNRHPLFPGEALLQRAVLKIVEVAGPWLVLFCIVDDHAHVVPFCDRRRCATLARGLQRGLRGLAVVETQTMYTGVIHGRNHMEKVRRYVSTRPTQACG